MSMDKPHSFLRYVRFINNEYYLTKSIRKFTSFISLCLPEKENKLEIYKLDNPNILNFDVEITRKS